MIRTLRLCADISGYCLFDLHKGPVEPKSLKLSKDLIAALKDWENLFLANHVPHLLYWWSPSASISLWEFSEIGEKLRHRLQKELGNNYHIHYTNDAILQKKFQDMYQTEREAKI